MWNKIFPIVPCSIEKKRHHKSIISFRERNHFIARWSLTGMSEPVARRRGNCPPPHCVFKWILFEHLKPTGNNINHVWSQYYKVLVVLKYHRRPWVNIYDTDIFRCINTDIKMVYLVFFGIFMLLQMSVSKILTQGSIWYFKTTTIL